MSTSDGPTSGSFKPPKYARVLHVNLKLPAEIVNPDLVRDLRQMAEDTSRPMIRLVLEDLALTIERAVTAPTMATARWVAENE